MTANKRRKSKIAAEMKSSGTNYLRAARDTTSVLKDPVNLTWSPGVNQLTGKKYADKFTKSSPHLVIAGGLMNSLVVQDVVFQLIQSNSSKDIQFWIIDSSYTYNHASMKPYLSAFAGAPHVSRYLVSDAHIEGSDTKSDDSVSRQIMKTLEDLKAVAGHRSQVFNEHPRTPKSLEEARAIAASECAESGMNLEDHPLYLPYIFLTVHNTSNLRDHRLAPVDPEFENDVNSLLNDLRLRDFVNAGIYMICGTQNSRQLKFNFMKRMARYIFLRTGEEVSHEIAGDASLHEQGYEDATARKWGKESPAVRLKLGDPRPPAVQEKMVRSSR